jgi:hypothetical protein
MGFSVKWATLAYDQFEELESYAKAAKSAREARGKRKSSKQEGLFKQTEKAINMLLDNPRHPGLRCHEFNGLVNPYDKEGKVFEAYIQNNTPGAYRLFWCYGPDNNQLTIIAIRPHPD